MAEDDRTATGWDFFVSYTQADRAWAEWIAWQLEEAGDRVLVQAWDFVGGSNWINRMQEGVARTRRTIAVLSEQYLSSVFGTAEWQAAWASDPLGQQRKLLVVRVGECSRPGLLSGVVGIDVFGVDEAKARMRLRKMVADARAGRAKPDAAPPFPGSGRAIPREPRFPGALPTVFKAPPRNARFTGRAKELSALAAAFASGSRVTVHSLHGMGGVGKTQLATEYAHAHATDYDLVWWIDAEQPALIPDQFTALAGRLGVQTTTDPDAVRAAVHEALRETSGWLLVFDNADDVEDIERWLPPGPQRPGLPGHVIITTRRGGFASLGEVLDLDVMPVADAVQLLHSRVLGADEPVLRDLANELGRLPLALEQAAAYIDRSGMPPREYLDLFRARSYDLHGRGRAIHRRETIATLWDLSLQRIADANPAAVQLLEICSYLAPEPIPLDLFTKYPDELPEPLSHAAADPLEFADTLAILMDYSLAKRSPDTIQLHRLVQDVIRTQHLRDLSSEGGHQ